MIPDRRVKYRLMHAADPRFVFIRLYDVFWIRTDVCVSIVRCTYCGAKKNEPCKSANAGETKPLPRTATHYTRRNDAAKSTEEGQMNWIPSSKEKCLACQADTRGLSPSRAFLGGLACAIQHSNQAIANSLCEDHGASFLKGFIGTINLVKPGAARIVGIIDPRNK